MEEKMDSEHSYSGGSSSSTESSSGSSEGDEEILEPVRVLGHTFELPQELCEDYSVFKEFFSMKTWNSLEDTHKEELSKFLPKFTEDEEEEKEKTIKILFNHEPIHFTSPFSDFYSNLRQGNYRPDIAKMRKFLIKARTKQQRHKIKSYYAKLLPEVLLSRERLLAAVKSAPPGPVPRLPILPPKPSSKSNYKPLYLRARHRYFEELAAIRSELGGDETDDDNYPEGPPEYSSRKKKHVNVPQNVDGNISGTLGGIDQSSLSSLECLKNVLAAHRTRRQYRENHPELNTTGITLEDLKQRVNMVNGAKKLMFGGQKSASSMQKLKKGPKKESKQNRDKAQSKKVAEEYDVETKPLLPNIKIKCEQEESDSGSSSFVDPIASPKGRKIADVDIKQEIIDPKYPSSISNYSDSKLDAIVKQEPPDPSSNSARAVQPVPIKLEDLDGIDMMALPVEIADDSGEVITVETEAEETKESIVHPDESLTETTHANFLSLVRALFPARAAHRASRQQLQARCTAVMRSPIAPLNTWYNLSDDWCAELESALDFLAGERGQHPDDFVPYLQYLPETQMYQWIGAGRDCDALLGRLCERWRRIAPLVPSNAPPPRYPTSWSVRPATDSEIAEFRAQERRRFSAAVKPFTYIQHGYRSVVGPCVRGGAGAALLPSRPRAATLHTLVRDALARLPNGEGTKQHILIMLKMSQWLAPCSEQALLSAVTSVLERLVSVKRDPVVKFDQRTAVWTYLHRNRSEEDWLKISSGRARANKALPASSVQKEHTLSGMDLEVGSVEEVIENASDSDVDVDDSTVTPASNLSSAQLLMQATQTQTKPVIPQKPKGKLVATPPPKGKYNVTPKPKPAALMSQSAKQANLLAQVVRSNINQAKQNAQAKTPLKQPPKQIPTPKTNVTQPKPTIKPTVKTPQAQTTLVNVPQSPKTKIVVSQANVPQLTSVQTKSLPSVTTASKSPLIKQRPLQKVDTPQAPVNQVSSTTVVLPTSQPSITSQPTITIPPSTASIIQIQNKVTQGTRSLLIRPTAVQTNVTAAISTPTSQMPPTTRRGVVRVLSPATPASGKSLISPRALMQDTTTKKRPIVSTSASVTTMAQSASSPTTVVSSASVVTSIPRTVQLAGGRTVQLAGQSVQLAGQSVQLAGQSVQLAGQPLHLSTLHSVRLPSGQTVQLASPQPIRVSTPRQQLPMKPNQPTRLQIPVSTVQLAGQTVQIAGQTVQIAGTSVQLTGHTVKLPGGQSVQVAGQNVNLQSVQLPSGQTVQLGGNMQTVQMPSGQTVQLGGQTVQLAGQTVQLGGQTVQIAGQTVQLPSGQTLQLPSGQTVQLSSGQTLQLASGQTVQLANQKPLTQVVRSQAQTDKAAAGQPIVAKLLTNAQGQMISLEGMVGAPRALQVSGVRPRAAVRVLSPSSRLTRPLLLTSAKPLHNIILQQSDGNVVRVTSAGAASSSQTLVLGNIGGQSVTTPTTATPVLKLQQTANATSGTPSGVRSVLMDGQQLKLVGGRHVLARILRPAHPPQ